MTSRLVSLVFFCTLFALPAWGAPAKTSVTETSKLSWKEVMQGVQMAPVQGNPEKGPSHFFLKYAGGLKTPVHHHSPDHYVTLLSGNMLLAVDGVEHKLTPGSFFALTNKAKHVVVCEESADCLMSIDARGKWDVVAEKTN